MNGRSKLITEQALALPRKEQEAIYPPLRKASASPVSLRTKHGKTRLKTGSQLTTAGKSPL